MPGDVLFYEPDTLLHWNHIRSHQKKWHEIATVEQMVFFAELFGEWLIAENYEKNNEWVSSALKHLNYIQTKRRLLELENELQNQLNYIKTLQTPSRKAYLSPLINFMQRLHQRMTLFLK